MIAGSLLRQIAAVSIDRQCLPETMYGHPSLVRGGKARIGGELIFDPDATPPIWYLNNKSGRYGLRADRTVAHLQNVQKLFREHGLEFHIDFRPPGQS